MANSKIKLDMDKVAKRKHEEMSTEEALKDIVPIDWAEDVLNGERKITIKKDEINLKACYN